MGVVDWLALVLLWGAAISRIRPAMYSVPQRMLWGAFTSLALSRVFSAVPVVAWLDATTHTELATLLRHLTGLLSVTYLLAYVETIIQRVPDRSRARWIWSIAAAVMAVLTLMFLLRGGRIYWVDGAYAPGETAWQGRVYLAVFDAWLMTCLASAGWMFARYARKAPTLLRVGLVLSTVGMVSGVINRAEVMIVNVAHLLVPDTTWAESPVFGQMTLLVCIVGITAGTSIPAWRAGAARLREMRIMRELRPLWDALTGLYPDVALGMKGTLQTRRVRQVVEIRDGMLKLTSVSEAPASENPREVAEWLRSSLEAARERDEVGVPSGNIPGPDFAGDIERETAWLLQVSAAFRQPGGKRAVSPAS
ncbi:MAB_1171c family putative transporter [Nonomuraea sp. NPDC046802]|uniref:MAB_1171c family putative transporter n=1 Tax=Nonomuraea sp. NPDC046802 TaxID=3154919 RepID=UPI0033CCDE4E